MEARWVRLWTFVLVVLLSCPLPPPVQAAQAKGKAKGKKAAPVVQAEEDAWPPAEVTVGFVTRESETEGLGDVLIPLWNPGEKGLLFLNPRASFTDHNEEEGNLGIGYRQLLPRPGIILGVNAYYDYRDTDAHHYDQWGMGVEMLSDWIDARANYYDPDDDAHVINRQTETSTHQSTQTQDRFSDPYAADHYIVQDYVTTRTLTTVTSSRTFEQFEAAYGGYDLELGLRLPLPIERETLEARVFGGYYDFDNDYTDDAQGWKARAEVRVLSSLFLDAGAYENDDLTGSDWYAGARWSVPLDLAKIAQGRNPFSTAGSRLKGEPRDLSGRLTEMVMRDSQIRVETSGFIENESLATEEVARESHSDRETFALMADVNFVDGDEGTAAGDGTADNPYATIQQGVDAVFGTRNVYVFNASTPYEENVVLTRGVTLRGSGEPIYGVNGAMFGGLMAPIVDGMGTGASITMADRTTVSGFIIRNTASAQPGGVAYSRSAFDDSRIGILGNGANDLTITGNLITGNQVGVFLIRQGDFQLDFSRNQVTGNDGYGGIISAVGNSGTCDITVSHSAFDGNEGGGLSIQASTYDQSRIRIQNSQFLNNDGNGLAILQQDTGDARTAISSSLAGGNAQNGLDLRAQGNDQFRAAITGSEFSGNTGSGVGVASVGNQDSRLSLQGSLLANNAQNGIQLEATGGVDESIQVTGSAFTNNGSRGLLFQAVSNGTFAADIRDALFLGNAVNGIEGISQHGATTGVSMVDCAFVANAQTGVGIIVEDGVGADIQMDDIVASANGAHGVFVGTANLEDSRIAIRHTTANSNQGNGIFTSQTNGFAFRMRPGWAGEARVEMDGVEANGNTNGIGIEVLQFNNMYSQAGISNSVVNGNGEAGLAVIQSQSGLELATVEDTTADGNAGTGAVVVQTESEMALAAVGGLQANDNESYGVLVNQSDVYLALANISGSSANRNTNSGIVLAQNSLMASVGVVGMPEGVEAIVTGLVAQSEIELPEQLLPVLTAAGPVTASENGGSGVQAQILSEGMVSLGGFFDITANQNGVSGVNAMIFNPDGMAAVGLAGSSENWGEILQLGAQIGEYFDLDLPLDVVGTGHMQVNGNGFAGLQMVTVGGTAALNAVVGLEATDNGLWGAISLAQAEEIAANALARVTATSNDNGIAIMAGSENLAAVNLLADVNASHNANYGILSSASCESGIAAVATFSTDALRPLEPLISEFADQPFELPGEPFGPVVVSDNGGSGFVADVDGGRYAVAALLDTQADRNGGNGIELDIQSDEGQAYSVLASSDLVYDLVNARFEIDPPITNAGLGAVSASGNGSNGIVIVQGGAEGAYSVLGGVEASGNLGGSGIVVDLTGIDNDAQMFLVGVNTHSNAGHGVAADLYSQNEDVMAGLVDVRSSYNATQGIQVVANSIGDDAVALVAGVGLAHNGGDGLAVNLIAGDDVGLALTGLASVSNAANGAEVQLTSGGDLEFYAGTNAMEHLDVGYTFLEELGSFADLIPTGRVYFNGNGANGLSVDGTTTAGGGDILSLMGGITANGNTGLGIRTWMDAYASTGNIDDDISAVEALGNTGAYDVLQHARVQTAGTYALTLAGVFGTRSQEGVTDP